MKKHSVPARIKYVAGIFFWCKWDRKRLHGTLCVQLNYLGVLNMRTLLEVQRKLLPDFLMAMQKDMISCVISK